MPPLLPLPNRADWMSLTPLNLSQLTPSSESLPHSPRASPDSHSSPSELRSSLKKLQEGFSLSPPRRTLQADANSPRSLKRFTHSPRQPRRQPPLPSRSFPQDDQRESPQLPLLASKKRKEPPMGCLHFSSPSHSLETPSHPPSRITLLYSPPTP